MAGTAISLRSQASAPVRISLDEIRSLSFDMGDQMLAIKCSIINGFGQPFSMICLYQANVGDNLALSFF